MARSWGPDNTDSGAGSDGELARFAAETRVDEAIRGRSRERWLRQQEREATTLRDLCVSLAEVGAAVAITMDAGRSHRGRITAVGADFLVCANENRSTWLALVAVATVTAAATLADARETSMPQLGARFVDALAALCGSGTTLAIALGSGVVVTGEALWLSEDVVAVRSLHGQGATTYLRLASLAEFSVTASG